MKARGPIAWFPLMMAMLSGAVLAGAIGWRISVKALDAEIRGTQSALKKLVLSGRIPPNQEVMDYLTSRQVSVEDRYRRWVEAVAAPPLAAAAAADPQVYFQERFHEIQRMLERFATARSMDVPQLLGFPKELPPSDTVPRLLVQLSLIQETAEVVFEQGVAALSSFKIEDPVTLPEEEGTGTYLMRLPVEVRCAGTLPQLMKILGRLQLAQPMIDVRTLRLASSTPPARLASPNEAAGVAQEVAPPAAEGAAPGMLDVEFSCSRYLVMTTSPEPIPGADGTSGTKKKTGRSGTRPSAQRQTATKTSSKATAASEP